jgi:hypothetical protein
MPNANRKLFYCQNLREQSVLVTYPAHVLVCGFGGIPSLARTP